LIKIVSYRCRKIKDQAQPQHGKLNGQYLQSRNHENGFIKHLCLSYFRDFSYSTTGT